MDKKIEITLDKFIEDIVRQLFELPGMDVYKSIDKDEIKIHKFSVLICLIIKFMPQLEDISLKTCFYVNRFATDNNVPFDLVKFKNFVDYYVNYMRVNLDPSDLSNIAYKKVLKKCYINTIKESDYNSIYDEIANYMIEYLDGYLYASLESFKVI